MTDNQDWRPTWVAQHMALSDKMEIWEVPPDKLQRQALNARYMPHEMMEQLTTNVAKRGELEGLPFCAWVKDRLEIVSGHHRTRAAKAAGLKLIWVMVDVTNLTRDQIRAKQLAHNSLAGEDDAGVLLSIFESISDANSRIEAYIDANALADKLPPTVLPALNVQLKTKSIMIAFTQPDIDALDDLMTAIMASDAANIYVATAEEYEPLRAMLNKLQKHIEVRATPAVFAALVEYAEKGLEAELKAKAA